MSQHNARSKCVYVGSIPYDQTEQQVLDLCSNAGPVARFRMVFDPQTGRSRGYAFAEYRDLESSAAAVRNLNGYPLGSRHLKCGYATGSDLDNNNSGSAGGGLMDSTMQEHGGEGMRFPGLPAGVDVNINMTTPAMVISSEIGRLTRQQQLDTLRGLQNWARGDRAGAQTLVGEYPQLTFVIAELLLTTGLCQVDDLTQLATTRQNEDQPATEAREGPPAIDEETYKRQLALLRQVLQLSDSEIAALPDNERMTLWDLRQRTMRGEFGTV
ncbi:Rna15p KNAG_0D03250 [Huiozyma naganishii CBS 8797]|uniref:RRM domain-containing protein n=1 Tax=Huiozyma naganishii (strain ATCC MYA-139 / BCRC 22969 / CBS 8797 / KCTC 17520 / NBRC 10181 / NCYC 3082 / Yp74L-3) TaxID=1071383 RepID=J7S728_HUIN7|nr:hypothetical protein KNAG_0D03250 [Kazachstania naganishii CBS 8797]CCK70071.1 hypothetical protein KNAG_0D03250 [Kazachstania naganishii CBS 8797]